MAAGSSLAICSRFISSRQESPASTRMRVRLLETSVLFPLDPEASTVILIIPKAYPVYRLITGLLPKGCHPRHPSLFNIGKTRDLTCVPASPRPPCVPEADKAGTSGHPALRPAPA